jgi:hypothetical protein
VRNLLQLHASAAGIAALLKRGNNSSRIASSNVRQHVHRPHDLRAFHAFGTNSFFNVSIFRRLRVVGEW